MIRRRRLETADSTLCCLVFYASPLLQGSSKPIGFVPGLDDVCPVGQPIQHRLAEPGIWKHHGPFREGQVCCYDHSGPLRTTGYHRKEQFGCRFRYCYIAHLVDHNEFVACPPVGDSTQSGTAPDCGWSAPSFPSRFFVQQHSSKHPFREKDFVQILEEGLRQFGSRGS